MNGGHSIQPSEVVANKNDVSCSYVLKSGKQRFMMCTELEQWYISNKYCSKLSLELAGKA